MRVILLILFALPAFAADNFTYIYREPAAWGAIYKYCIACHSAATIDNTDFSTRDWGDRVDICSLKARYGGYPAPTEADKEALKNFLPQVTPINRNPPIYLYPPARGSLATP
ncbi:MAG: hypothetical protein LBV09_07140 [Deferribacteraceae bacterium]|nr:hypothetical protein [Deferribacteraceae bacterium]